MILEQAIQIFAISVKMNPDYVKIDKDFTARAMSSEKDHELFRKNYRDGSQYKYKNLH